MLAALSLDEKRNINAAIEVVIRKKHNVAAKMYRDGVRRVTAYVSPGLEEIPLVEYAEELLAKGLSPRQVGKQIQEDVSRICSLVSQLSASRQLAAWFGKGSYHLQLEDTQKSRSCQFPACVQNKVKG